MYEDLTGNIAIVDLLSDEEDVVPLNGDLASSAPENRFRKVSLEEALHEILQVLPDIDPKG